MSYSTKWQRAPSVTTGGKAYFWTRVKNNVRYWVVWDRQKRMWAATKESTRGGQVDLAWFKTPSKGRNYVDSL